MTKDEILAKWDSLSPRERDAWVAEEIMGWTGKKTVYQWFDRKKHEYPVIIFAIGGKGIGSYETFVDEDGNKIQYGKPHRIHFTLNYSTDIAAAWEVRQWVHDNIGGTEIVILCDELPELCDIWNGKKHIRAQGLTAPEAIAKAALLAKLEGKE